MFPKNKQHPKLAKINEERFNRGRKIIALSTQILPTYRILHRLFECILAECQIFDF